MMPATTSTPSPVSLRTEDGYAVTLPSDRVINTAKRWSPHRVYKEQVEHLAPGDFISTDRGWSSIVEITR
jgi:hypothetical protein